MFCWFFFKNCTDLYLYLRQTGSCIEGESWLLGDWQCIVAQCWVVVWVWRHPVKAGPSRFISALTALIYSGLDAIFLITELGQGLFPLYGKKPHALSFIVTKHHRSRIKCTQHHQPLFILNIFFANFRC